ncbi:protein containing diguanylate cyclase (GGDEF) domain [Bellilinea caldifistulae]|nr:protein containing diguanylate cyclase (GGDEF) domain [Bellilinea caldifistulae]
MCAYLAAWSSLRHRQPGALEFGLLTWATAIYSLGYAVEISRNNLEDVLWAIRVEYLGLAFLPPLILIFTFRFVRNKPLNRAVVAGLLTVSFITLGLVWTVNFHSLYYISPRIESGNYFPGLVFERGPWYKVHLAYLLLAGSLSPILLFWHARRAEGRRRSQMIVLGLGALIPIVGGYLFAAGKIPYGIDVGPFALSLSVLFFWAALFRYGLFEIVPAARELALDTVGEALIVVDYTGRVIDLNRAAIDLPGLAGLKIGQMFPRDGVLSGFVFHSLQNSGGETEFSTEDQNGNLRSYRARSYLLKDTLGRQGGCAVLITDISETTRLIRRLDEQASTDELTGLLNRRSIMQIGSRLIEQLSSNGGWLGIVLMDLDHFKEINDSYGHQAGDTVLRCVGECLPKALRDEDVIGRWGGDEFVVFLPGADRPAAWQVAERLRAQVAACEPLKAVPTIRVSASFGVYAACVDGSVGMDDLMRAADQALYRAKNNGRNQSAV